MFALQRYAFPRSKSIAICCLLSILLLSLFMEIITIHIGKEIKKQSEIRRIGPTELGSMIGTSKQNVYGIYGRHNVTTDLLEKLCRVMDYDFFQFYYRDHSELEGVVSKLTQQSHDLNATITLQGKLITQMEKVNHITIT